jgi:hypothetical protein
VFQRRKDLAATLCRTTTTSPWFLDLTVYVPATSFFDHIRQYNSMFTMTLMGAKVMDSINYGHGPYVFKISGQVCHRIGSLLPTEGARLEYA